MTDDILKDFDSLFKKVASIGPAKSPINPERQQNGQWFLLPYIDIFDMYNTNRQRPMISDTYTPVLKVSEPPYIQRQLRLFSHDFFRDDI